MKIELVSILFTSPGKFPEPHRVVTVIPVIFTSLVTLTPFKEIHPVGYCWLAAIVLARLSSDETCLASLSRDCVELNFKKAAIDPPKINTTTVITIMSSIKVNPKVKALLFTDL
ncbi:MAG: hypothetical protein UW64_C0001G0041 [Microgenomates group bacterium GW2011_GWC1_44_37]|uniref:Uncharacterized protein n=1 Tax=Candidatus Collierbacteria bacterium GW2011_GWB2_44_22 TaxID=1618387 RepID=A0A0G1HZL1_9BACT|nr:MAG: hypothetical protein UW31_C0009G0019 [Candidatus Collierbacteria bacterium GW2011_GWA2_44_13]KKT51539.1 MAG: hypothetical protein UW42_C0001G0014 [Candidatus Collierbacteria bacterium GW2011_GWB1_44_197]KKT52008.1 MAG: hypothetical protein UW44_C0005G0050 [Candidatus Collierbacteria bacterium GW2011_GWB2_44_22]KKT62134.1 MAG: hypothetical protein UW56_C0011G0019 [Candidatus Collierbacteria bacterium GW2011_GWD1_44_27]KKT69395.1 MAG: hypothetical protein UW64_C0001G0041 [Microgenomates g